MRSLYNRIYRGKWIDGVWWSDIDIAAAPHVVLGEQKFAKSGWTDPRERVQRVCNV